MLLLLARMNFEEMSALNSAAQSGLEGSGTTGNNLFILKSASDARTQDTDSWRRRQEDLPTSKVDQIQS